MIYKLSNPFVLFSVEESIHLAENFKRRHFYCSSLPSRAFLLCLHLFCRHASVYHQMRREFLARPHFFPPLDQLLKNNVRIL